MAASDDDDELQRAIALSLEDELAPSATDGESDYDRDLRLAMALSLEGTHNVDDVDSAMGSRPKTSKAERSGASLSQYTAAVAYRPENSAQQQIEVSKAINSPPSTSSGIAGLHRKAMERERLERLGKRKRSASPERPSKQVVKQPAPSIVESKTKDGLQYPNGAVKRTWAYKHTRTDDITLEEVLQASTLNIAVLSSFQWEDRFLFHKADPEKIKHYWIMNAKTDDLREKILQELVECRIPNLKPHFPPMDGQIANMHSKLMLLFHDTHLRIVVPTANMMKVDWGESGQDPKTVGTWQPAVFENSLFLIDLPRCLEGKDLKNIETSFGKSLISFLEAQKVRNNIIEGLRKFDFSQTDHFAFVHSIGGSHSKEQERSRTGLHGLSRAIRQLHLNEVECLELDYAASSLGALKEDFLKQIYLAASGLPPLRNTVPSNFLDRFRIYFPVRDTVVNSTGGVDCGGIITLNRAFFNNPSFPRKCLRDYKSTRSGVLSHNKLLLARGYKADGTPFAWAYIGSANVSEAAWGAQKLLKSGKDGVLSIRNWECGVVVPVPKEKLQGFKYGEVPPMRVFEGTVEVPFQFPGEKYAGREPWFFQG
ncbi:hypothetical protein N0V90_001245 [Kalmusia sp. IMI 367209]|nr:hypothetical protein N0V90_001245 [Kalmusia sp. IMI 367209]